MIVRAYQDWLELQKQFKFNTVLDPSDDQEDVFNKCRCTSLVSKVIDGFHATILAYG